jgi:L-2-hydroxyglutarate oxidase LhgO
VEDVDCIVIGAGVIGLAVARALAQAGREVIILESERQVGMHTSSRNSEVIHAGLHYHPNSLKASLCVAGKELLYRYCAEQGVAHSRCGKLTVAAAAAQMAALENIAANARASGVCDLQWLNAAQAQRLEPALQCTAALHSPSSGIIDSHGYMQSLLTQAERLGANLVFGTTVTALRPTSGGIEVVAGEGEPVRARRVVNCAGLNAHRVAASVEGLSTRYIPAIHYAKGSYFSLAGKSPFTRLIYPVPSSGGHLGIHMTLDLGGAARFGPDFEWVEKIDYAVDSARAAVFYDAIREYWPALQAGQLQAAYAGVRPKLSAAGEATRDFYISDPKDHGISGLVNLFGMESPGLTASLAIGEYITALLSSY